MKIFLLLSLLFFTNRGFSQEIKIVQYDAANGLPSSEVYDIIQDDYGYLWFSTDRGLSRYNGYEFETFDQSDGLPDNVVFEFFKQINGEVWCTTNSMKLFKFEGNEPIFSSYKFNDSIKIKNGHQTLNSIYIAANKDIYISFNHIPGYLQISSTGEIKRELEIINKDSVTVYPYVLKNDSLAPFFFNEVENSYPKEVFNVEFDRFPERTTHLPNEALFIESQDVGVYSYTYKIKLKYGNGDIIRIDSTNTKIVIALGKFDTDQFWVGYSYGGAKIFNTEGKELATLLTNQSVTKLYKDRDGNVWASSLEGGIFQIKNQTIKTISASIGRRVNSLCAVDKGIYFGYESGDIDYLNRNGSIEKFYQCKLNHRAVIAHDSIDDVTYFCADYLFSSESPFLGTFFSRYITFNKENICFGERALLIMEKNDNSYLVFSGENVSDAIFYKGHLYGGSLKGLHIMDLKEKELKSSLLMKGTRIDDLNLFYDHLVLGTNSNGIIILNENHQIIAQIGEKNGLRSNSVSRTFTENDSTLWVCTNNGLNRIKFDANGGYEISYVDVNDGLSSNEIQDVTIYNDTVFIGTQKGVNYLSTKEFNEIQEQNKAYFLQWKKIKVNDNNISVPADNNFKHSENKFEFNFQAISFTKSDNLNYRYKLVGFDKVWSLTKNRNIIYSSLAPGEYELILQVKGRNGNWELNEIRYSFTVNPPLWWTWWFISLIVLAIIGIIYLFFKVRILTYNKDIVREILRLIMQRLRNDRPFIFVKHNGKEVKVYSTEIHYIKTNSNYLELHTIGKKYFIRSSIQQFLKDLPDSMEYLQIHRSYVVRLDNIQEVGKKFLVVLNKEIPIGRKYNQALKLIQV